MPDLLIISAVRWAVASGIGSVVQINRFFSQCLIQLFQRSRLRTAKENTRIHIADDGIGIVLVDCLQLALCLKYQTCRDFS